MKPYGAHHQKQTPSSLENWAMRSKNAWPSGKYSERVLFVLDKN